MDNNKDTPQKHLEFQASSNTWSKCSDYEIYKDEASGGLWIKPKVNAAFKQYEPMKGRISSLLLKKIIILGRELEEHFEPYDSGTKFPEAFVLPYIKFNDIQKAKYSKYKEILTIEKKDCNGNYYMFAAEKILKFVKIFGLLGLYSELDPTALSYNRTYSTIMKYFFPHIPEQFLPRNSIDQEEFWSIYFEPVELIEQFARHIYFISQIDSYYNKKKFIVGGESVRLHLPDEPCYLDEKITWGEWFNEMLLVDDISIKPKYYNSVQTKYKNERKVTSFKWQIDWVFPSLLKAINIIQVLNFMSEYQFVKTCRCGITFIPYDKRSEHCSIKCRTRLNTWNSRHPEPENLGKGLD